MRVSPGWYFFSGGGRGITERVGCWHLAARDRVSKIRAGARLAWLLIRNLGLSHGIRTDHSGLEGPLRNRFRVHYNQMAAWRSYRSVGLTNKSLESFEASCKRKDLFFTATSLDITTSQITVSRRYKPRTRYAGTRPRTKGTNGKDNNGDGEGIFSTNCGPMQYCTQVWRWPVEHQYAIAFCSAPAISKSKASHHPHPCVCSWSQSTAPERRGWEPQPSLVLDKQLHEKAAQSSSWHHAAPIHTCKRPAAFAGPATHATLRSQVRRVLGKTAHVGTSCCCNARCAQRRSMRRRHDQVHNLLPLATHTHDLTKRVMHRLPVEAGKPQSR
jgi:hypothetical protein